MISRAEFEKLSRETWAEYPKGETAIDLLTDGDQYMWIHQTRWLGEPCLQTPEDLFAIENIVYKHGIKNVIELGVAWGGTSLFLSSIGMDVTGIDIYIPKDLRTRIHDKDPIDGNILLIEGDTLTVELGMPYKNCLIILDSDHTHDHVLKELELYSPIADYLVVCDTIIESMPVQTHRPREWGPGNSPKTALDEFLSHHRDWEIDPDVNLLMSCNSYVRRK